jgi:DNA-binding beta-propeller fold protein YncE
MKNIKLTVILITATVIVNIQAQEVYQNERLSKLWVSKEGNKTPESVLFDPVNKVLYVANIDENPWGKDNKGNISKLSLTGDFITKDWVKGLSAPKGMGISKGMLYVTDITEVAEIDLKNGVIVKKYTHPKAENLNDITVGADGTVYVSDSKGSCLFHIIKGKLEILFESEELTGTNGIFYENGKLLCGQKNRVASFDLKTKSLTTLIENTGGIDGLEAVGDGSYIISDWSGKVQIVQPGKPNLTILDTTPLKINAADIEFDPISKTLYVPTFFDNHVDAYKLK